MMGSRLYFYLEKQTCRERERQPFILVWNLFNVCVHGGQRLIQTRVSFFSFFICGYAVRYKLCIRFVFDEASRFLGGVIKANLQSASAFVDCLYLISNVKKKKTRFLFWLMLFSLPLFCFFSPFAQFPTFSLMVFKSATRPAVRIRDRSFLYTISLYFLLLFLISHRIVCKSGNVTTTNHPVLIK